MPAEPPSLKELFLAVLAVPPAERPAWLEKQCGQDAELRRRVELMLAAHDTPQSLLDRPPLAAVPPEAATADIAGQESEQAGAVIGPYKLLQQIGEGGMGTVFMAEQQQPVRRKVALKVIKPGMDSRQVIVRFEAERQALAMMDHVNIARVLDAGTTAPIADFRLQNADCKSEISNLQSAIAGGRPYFVMELVHGVPITKYCDDNHLTPRQRLELFVPVCQAIQHAHQKGIIHRDIKPSNILVTMYDGKPVPKVIDFGVAKATEQPLTERTLFTQYGTMVGTLEYMSPEQAEMSALGVDTRSDIYSLGVLLYELLTGSTPLSHKRLKEAAYAEILRMIKEEEPPKPSTRLSDSGEALASISAQRHMEPAKLTKLVRGELDWIVMKTLEKDRNRRYETASAFAADVQRYLHDEAVEACPPSALYKFRKFARRYRAALATAAVVSAALVLAVVVLAMSNMRVTKERNEKNEALSDKEEALRQARMSFQKARQAVDRYFTQVSEEDLLGQPGMQLLRKKLLQSALEYYQSFVAEHGDDLELSRELAEAFRRVGAITMEIASKAQAQLPLQKAIELYSGLYQKAPEDEAIRMGLAQSLHLLASVQVSRNGEPAKGEQSAQRAIALLELLCAAHPGESAHGRLLGDCWNLVGWSHSWRSEYSEAKPFFTRALTVLERTSKEAPGDLAAKRLWARTLNNLGVACGNLGQRAEQERSIKQCQALYQQILLADPADQRSKRDWAISLGSMGNLLYDLGHINRAGEDLQKACDIFQELARANPEVNDYPYYLCLAAGRLGEVCLAQGRTERAKQLFTQAVALGEKSTTKDPENLESFIGLAWWYYRLGMVEAERGRTAVGLAFCEKARAMQENALRQRPENRNFHSDLLWSQEEIGRLRVGSAQITASAQAADQFRIIDERRRLLQSEPRNRQWQYELAESQVCLAELSAGEGVPPVAVTALDAALRLLAEITKAQSENYEFQRLLAAAYALRGRVLSKLGETAAALKSAREAIAFVEKLASADSAYLYDLACHRALCGFLRSQDIEGATGRHAAESGRYAAASVAALARSVAAGYDNAHKLRTDSRLASLRERVDFKKLVRQLEEKGQEKTRSSAITR